MSAGRSIVQALVELRAKHKPLQSAQQCIPEVVCSLNQMKLAIEDLCMIKGVPFLVGRGILEEHDKRLQEDIPLASVGGACQ